MKNDYSDFMDFYLLQKAKKAMFIFLSVMGLPLLATCQKFNVVMATKMMKNIIADKAKASWPIHAPVDSLCYICFKLLDLRRLALFIWDIT